MAFRSVLVLATLVASSLPAQGILLPRICDRPLPRPLPPIGVESPPFVPCRFGPAAIVRTSTNVRVRLVDRVLRYEIDERFVNRGSTGGEADYVFPLPKNAVFQDLQLEINGELVAGETFGADEARRMYEEIVRKQRDPALVEWMGQGMLRARIFPIAPGEEKRVLVRFQSVAQREGDALRVDYFGGSSSRQLPLNLAGGDPSRRSEQGLVHLTLTYPNRSGLGRAYSPTHELDARDRGSETEVAVRGDARDATLLIPVARGNAAAISVLTNAPGREDGFVMVTVAPPEGTRDETGASRDITLVLDVSGSMAGAKMNQARAAGRQLLETLSSRDRFRLIDFATDVHTFRDDYVRATPENIQAARRYLDGLEAAGSTNIEGALTEVMRAPVDGGRLPLVLFITDGEPTVGERSPERLVDMARPRRGDPGRTPRRIFTFGLGADVNVVLLEQLALEGHGTSQFVRPDESVERAVGLVASRLVDPVLTDVHVRAEGAVSLTKMQPPAGSDLFAGQDLVVFARYTGDGSARIVVDGRQNGRAVQWTTTASFPDRAPENPFVARLWASQRIGFLSAERRRNGGSPELDAEIRTLGERFSIPTEFTSYFVREPMNGPGGRVRVGTLGAGVGGALAPTAAAAPRDAQFDAAKLASAQRSVSTMAKMDSMSVAQSRAVSDASSAGEQKVGGRTFRFDSGVWTDVRPAGTTRVVTIKAFSKAYFDLAKKLPELSSIMGIGEQITVVGRAVVVSIRTGSGLETLSDADLSRIAREW